MRVIVLRARWVVALGLAAFFGFVGWMKAFAPLAELRRHHAWTVALPEAMGRAVGWSEMLCALLLAASLATVRLARWHRPAALYFIANQIVAAGVHVAVGEPAALPQNAVLIAAFAFLAATARQVPILNEKREKIT